jgi:hypothetical protein
VTNASTKRTTTAWGTCVGDQNALHKAPGCMSPGTKRRISVGFEVVEDIQGFTFSISNSLDHSIQRVCTVAIPRVGMGPGAVKNGHLDGRRYA